MEEYTFTIPLNPITKKNSQRIVMAGRYPKILPSQKYVEYERECKSHIPPLHIDYPVNIKAVYYRQKHIRVDLCNLHEALCDVLVKYGCIEDDCVSIVETMDGSICQYDKYNPRTEITITRR